MTTNGQEAEHKTTNGKAGMPEGEVSVHHPSIENNDGRANMGESLPEDRDFPPETSGYNAVADAIPHGLVADDATLYMITAHRLSGKAKGGSMMVLCVWLDTKHEKTWMPEYVVRQRWPITLATYWYQFIIEKETPDGGKEVDRTGAAVSFLRAAVDVVQARAIALGKDLVVLIDAHRLKDQDLSLAAASNDYVVEFALWVALAIPSPPPSTEPAPFLGDSPFDNVPSAALDVISRLSLH